MASPSRRAVLRLAGLGALFSVVILRPWQRFTAPSAGFEPVPGLTPFRYLTGERRQSVAGAVDWMTVGLPGGSDGDGASLPDAAPDPCRALIGDWQAGGPVPITYFTDTYCPNCRAQERELEQVPTAGTEFRLITREFPVFGEASILAARAVLAAEAQGAGEAMRRHLLRAAPVRDAAALVAQAEAAGLDAVGFRAALAADAIRDRLAHDRAIARRLGLPGTPSMVVGRTIVIGVIGAESLGALIALEAGEGPTACDIG